MTKIAGSGSISLRHGSADPDPDPHQHVMDQQHCITLVFWIRIRIHTNMSWISNTASPWFFYHQPVEGTYIYMDNCNE
jgi:hypothetical protein